MAKMKPRGRKAAWTEEEDQIIRDMTEEGAEIRDIAERLDRGIAATQKRSQVIGIKRRKYGVLCFEASEWIPPYNPAVSMLWGDRWQGGVAFAGDL